jgi:hypothetical protein
MQAADVSTGRLLQCGTNQQAGKQHMGRSYVSTIVRHAAASTLHLQLTLP